MEIAEEEIERTSEEAVKAALLEVGGELAYEKERANLLEEKNLELSLEIQKLEAEKAKFKKRFLYGTAAGGALGVVAASFLLSLTAGR